MLTDAKLRTLKGTGKSQKHADAGGLYLLLSPAGGKLWRLDYRFEGKRKTLALGKYPEISLLEARAKRDAAKALLAQDIDPAEAKKQGKASVRAEAKRQALTFEAVAREWFVKRMTGKTERYRKQVFARLENQLFPSLGARPLADLDAQDLLVPLRQVEERGAVDMAHRLAQLLNQVCKYAKVAGYVRHNEAADLSEALTARKETRHRAAITEPAEIGMLLRAIAEYPGDIVTRYALSIMPYVFVRSGELRGAHWEEIDLDAGEWLIPAGRMKMRVPHVVPLARQVVALFKELREWTGQGALCFPSRQSASQCLSDVGLLNALRRMGYGREEMCIHGFRGTASTLLNEQGYRPDVIEAQLAHKERNAVRAAYNHAQYLPERRAMMQAWANYLDSLREQSGPRDSEKGEA